MLSERIFPTFPSEILPENASTLAYGPYGTVAIASGSLINFALISNQDKSLNNMNLKQIKPMFSISVGLNLVTALKFDTSKQLCADPILYIGDSAGNIFIYNYQKHEYLAVFSPNGHWKDDRYVHVQQIEIDYLPDSQILNRSNGSDDKNEGAGMEQKNNNFNKAYKNKNIIVLFKSKKIVSYSIIQDDDETYLLPISRSNSNNIRSSNSNLGIDIGNESSDLNFTSTRNNSSYDNSFYKSQVSNSIDSISSALNFTVNWVIDLENEMTNFSIDPFTNKKIFLYNKNKDNSFTILNLEEISGSFSSISSHTDKSDEKSSQNQIIPKIAFSSSLNKYDFKSSNNGTNNNFITPFNDTEIVVHRNSTIQCAQFSRHIQGYVYILTEHELILYSIDYDLFTRVNLTNQTLQKSAHFDKIIQFETDHRKILLVYKTGAMALFSLNSLFTLNNNSSSEKFAKGSKRRKRSVSDYKVSENPRRISRMSDTSKDEEMRKIALKNEVQINSKVHARDDHDVHFRNFESLRKNDNCGDDESNGKGNFSFKAIFEVKQIVQSQQFVTCASPPFESERDDIIVFLYHPFGIALFDMSRMRIVSCCPLFSDKETCFSTNDKFVAYGSIQGNIRIRSIFDNSFFFSLHVLDEPIKFVGISRKKNSINNNNNSSSGDGVIGLNGIRISFGSDKKVGEFCFDTRKLTVYRSPSSFSIKKVIGSYSGGLIVQRDDETAGVFVKGSEVFLSLPENDKIIDICFNENENENENDESGVGQDEKGSFMVLRKNNIVELYKYNKYTKYSFTDNNYNCSSFNFLNNNKISNTASQAASNSNQNQNQNLSLNSVSAAAMKRRIIAHPVAASSGGINSVVVGNSNNSNNNSNNSNTSSVSVKGKEKDKETKFVESTCVSLSGVDFALGFNDGSVFLLKTDDQTFAKRVEVLSNVPIVQMKFCSIKSNPSNNKLNRVLFCLTGDRILCEVSLLNNEITSKVTLSHVQSFTVINSSFIMVKNATNNVNSNGSTNDNNNSSTTNNNNNNNSSNSNNNSSSVSGSSNSNITSISSKSNLSQMNNINEEPKPNFYTPYDDDLIYPFPVLSKYKKNSRNRTRSILQEESSSSTEEKEKEKEQEVEEDSSYSILEKSLSFPILKEILRNFILNNPLTAIIKDIKSKRESNEIEECLSNRWFCLLPSIYDESTKTRFHNHILRNEGEICRSKIGLFGSPIHLPYQTDIGRDFWLLLLGRSCMRQECLYASGEGSLEYEVALSRILEGIASLSAPVNLNGSTIDRASSHHRITSPQSSLLKQRQLKQQQQQNQQHQQNIASEAREKKYRMELFYALVYAHRYDEATNVFTYNPESDTFMFNTILAAALLGFSEFDVDISSSQKDKEKNESSQKVRPNSVPSLKKLDSDSNSSFSLSMSAREQQYAVIKHAATQMIMLSTKTGRLVEGANLLRLSQLDSYAASILIQAGQVGLAMKFIRGMKKKSTTSTASKTQHQNFDANHIKFSNGKITNNSSENNNNNNENSGEKANFCYELGAMCYKRKYYREASFFFLTANEHFLALHSFFLFALTNFGPILAKSKSKSNSEPFNVHYARAICDIFFIKFFLEETGLLVEPLLCEKEEVLRKKKFEKLGNNVTSPLLDLNTLKSEIDKEFKLQIQHLMIDENLFFKSS